MNPSTEFIGIVAFCKNRGIGKGNTIPWNLKDDIQFFKTITTNNVVIMGRKTYDSIPEKHKPLKNRMNIVLTNTPGAYTSNHENLVYLTFNEVPQILDKCTNYPRCKVFIAGGNDIYNLFYDRMDSIYVTYIEKEYEVDTHFRQITDHFCLANNSARHWSSEEQCFYRFLKYEKNNKKQHNPDHTYIDLVKKVLVKEDTVRSNRTGVDTISIFGEQISFDISTHVPLLTTKRVAWKSCIEELLWFMRGDTDANILKARNVSIWNGNSSRDFLDKVGLNHLEEGDCGANYSFQWRHFGQKYSDCKTGYVKNTKYDQISNIIKLLKTDPFSRRIFMSAWNPIDLDKTVLPPCHVSAQFYVEKNPARPGGKLSLSCHMYQRSCDVFLGLPFNIFSYTMLTYILAKKCDMEPDRLIISLGDTHIYSNHIGQAKMQLERTALAQPKIIVSEEVVNKEIEEITINDFELVGYFPHNSIKAPMVV
uniref:Thymidylate synthase n=1 Tax=Pyramimonas orientalis virus TaxID=455367 RepID=A0A7M3UP29_POV01|nr:thymidylate synthase [Pyramimonas orientalis virus]